MEGVCVRVGEGTRSVLKPDLAGREEAFFPWVCCWLLVLSLLLVACCSLLVARCLSLVASGSLARWLTKWDGDFFEDGKRVFKRLGIRFDELRRVED